MKQQNQKFMKQAMSRSKNSTPTTRFVKRKEGNFFLIYDNKNKRFIPKEFYAPGGGEIGCNVFLRKLEENSKLAYQKSKK